MGTTLQEVSWPVKTDEERVRDFQRKLYQKAKEDKGFRFYVLYDKMRLPYMLREAYRRCRANQGAPGVDGLKFDDIEQKVGTGVLFLARPSFHSLPRMFATSRQRLMPGADTRRAA